ncbi:uncharacterized protein E0L32_007453 [Thyridium curvatum]|uniref:Uncharacterized protein n=1 Tax=Thyridium curvatum TaxID=1093900 RepID=A0A507AML9_9PEZI|nr:uncharacterized protein E0L32_007453 [Thyridium curvatum]TPX11955.1 hypothetical protein E0L32_007453 [Thyridium curvatum]
MKRNNDIAATAAEAMMRVNAAAPAPPPTVAQAAGANPTQRFNAMDIGYFDAGLPNEYGTGDIVQSGKDTYFRDVPLFMSSFTEIRSEEVVRRILDGEDDLVAVSRSRLYLSTTMAWAWAADQINLLEAEGFEAFEEYISEGEETEQIDNIDIYPRASETSDKMRQDLRR